MSRRIKSKLHFDIWKKLGLRMVFLVLVWRTRVHGQSGLRFATEAEVRLQNNCADLHCSKSSDTKRKVIALVQYG